MKLDSLVFAFIKSINILIILLKSIKFIWRSKTIIFIYITFYIYFLLPSILLLIHIISKKNLEIIDFYLDWNMQKHKFHIYNIILK